VMGVLADRFGRRTVVVPCLAVFGIAGGLGAFAPTFGVLILLRLIQGVASAGLMNLAVVIIGDTWSGEERARMIGRNAATLTAAVVVFPPIGGLLGTIGGWRLAFAPFWFGIAAAVLLARRLPRSVRRDSSLRDQLSATSPFIKAPAFLGAAVAGFIFFVLIFGLFLTVMPVYLDEVFKAPAGLRGIIAGLPAVTSTVSALTVSRWTFRFGVVRVGALGFGLLAAGFGLMAASPLLVGLMGAVLVYGLGEGLVLPILQDTVAGSAPDASRGAVVALFVSCLRAGQTVGPIVLAPLAVSAGARPVFALGAGVSAVLLLGVRWLVHPPRPILHQEPGPSGRGPMLAGPEQA
jgi:ACDE family multidrug resistance protein